MKRKTTKIMMVWMLTLSLLASNLTSVFAESETPEPQTTEEKSPKMQPMMVTEPEGESEVELFQDNENTEKVEFTGPELPEGWEIGGSSELTGNNETDVEGEGWLRLTVKESYSTGYAVYNQALETANGLAFSFDYASWGGSGADGMVFFLVDGEPSMDEFNIGGEGGSLGYSPRHKTEEGLSNAYVGIGLDEFGNFANGEEGRNGGIKRTMDSVTIRGSGDGFDGYDFIANSGNLNEGIDTPKVKDRPDQTGSGYRNVSLVFIPMGSQFMLSMKIQFGAENEAKEIFNDLILPGIVPATIKYGFTASSGSATNYHEIRNVLVDKAVVNDLKDSDSDGTPDIKDNCSSDPNKTDPGVCGCGKSDSDSDGDGTPDCQDSCSFDPNKTDPGVCGCGISDTDNNNNGVADCIEKIDGDSNKSKASNTSTNSLQSGFTIIVIPVTGSQMYNLSCTLASRLEIVDQAFAILPALCEYQGSLELAHLSNLQSQLPGKSSLVQAIDLIVKSKSNDLLNSISDDGLTIGFFIEPEMTKKDLAIYFWNATTNNGEGEWEEVETTINGNEITATAANVGKYILVER